MCPIFNFREKDEISKTLIIKVNLSGEFSMSACGGHERMIITASFPLVSGKVNQLKTREFWEKVLFLETF